MRFASEPAGNVADNDLKRNDADGFDRRFPVGKLFDKMGGNAFFFKHFHEIVRNAVVDNALARDCTLLFAVKCGCIVLIINDINTFDIGCVNLLCLAFVELLSLFLLFLLFGIRLPCLLFLLFAFRRSVPRSERHRLLKVPIRTAVPEKKFDSRIITGCGYLCLLLISVLQCGILFADILRHFYPHCVKLFVKCGFRKRKHLSRKYRGVGRTVDGNPLPRALPRASAPLQAGHPARQTLKL